MSLVSIITPYKNAEATIAETGASIFAQTHTNWEWILINDHSDQDELAVLGNFLNDPRIHVFQNEGNGIVDALVTGEKYIQGSFVTRMDADDVMPSEKLASFVEVLNNSSQQIVTGMVTYFSDSGLVSDGYRNYEKWLNDRVLQQDFYKHIYRECPVSSANWCMRTTAHFACGGFQNLRYPEDYDLVFRWKSAGFQIKGIERLTHLWREHPLRTSRNSAHYAQEAFFRLKVSEFIAREKRPIMLLGTGQKGRLTAKILLEQEVSFRWISHEPEKFPNGIYAVPILGVAAMLDFAGNVLNTTMLSFNEICSEGEVITCDSQVFQL
jgi:glycosyltransferase involved in cell wall biosynthesis